MYLKSWGAIASLYYRRLPMKQICGAVRNVKVLFGFVSTKSWSPTGSPVGPGKSLRRTEEEVTDLTDWYKSDRNTLSVSRHSAVEMHATMPCLTHTCIQENTHTFTLHTHTDEDIRVKWLLKKTYKQKFHNFLKVKTSTIKSLEVWNNPKVTTKHQYTPNMLLPLRSKLLLLHYTYSYTHMLDPAGRTGQFSVQDRGVQSDSQWRRKTSVSSLPQRKRTDSYIRFRPTSTVPVFSK